MSTSLTRVLVAAVGTAMSLGALQSSAGALDSADRSGADRGADATAAAKPAAGSKSESKERKRLTITKDGTVVDGARVHGSISVKADNVTIKDTTVKFGGYHSIRIFPGAEGTKILRTTIKCRANRTNGIVFGNYLARKVRVNDCRNDFMSSKRNPAVVLKSWVDGKPFEIKAPTTTTTVLTPPPPPSTGRPNASNTGVPAGTKLRPSGGMTITEDGTVIDALHVQGSITIEADNVTIRNSLIQTDTDGYPIHVDGGATGALIENVEIDNMGGTGIGILFSTDSSGTVRRANIHSAEDGVRIQGDDVSLEYSYVHDLQRQPGGHHDTVQIRSGDNITLLGNTLLPYVESTGDPMNAALQIGSLLGDDQISNLRVVGNYMNGGNYTINGGSDGIVDSAVYSGNRFGRDYRYGVVGNMDGASTWDNTNVWDDSSSPAR
ncbi:right-handed parallel beta-helix repeat-containing protein [Nocardioides xinjiangensis]|uniref:right-handed parallel beta-helix repeat-containing protein n=1 Tax=Nocardioides xinjiangensis TaxID=2817376 RepID=UPI001B315987|nr:MULTISPECIES: right-handed parallel beta-helix repeat-containing protein [unclassified Nocardioides]